jgi:hypothetical protein
VLKRAGLGFRAHSGWAAVVAIGGPVEAPQVVLRRCIAIADRAIPGSMQPYHAAERMALPDAAAFLHRCAEATCAMATKAIQDAIAELIKLGFEPSGSCVLLGSGRPSPDLARILAAHPLIHTAEGEFYRDGLRQACELSGLRFQGIREKALMDSAAQALGMRAGEIESRISEFGKVLGPPWRQDEKLSAVAAWIALANP